MSKAILTGIWRHVRTGNLYCVEGLARSTADPTKQVVVYSQNYQSQLKTGSSNIQIILPEGSIWTRDPEEFLSKFEKMPEDPIQKLFGLFRSSVNRWGQEQ